MSYVKPAELITSMIDAGESKILMSTRDTLIRAFMGGAMLTGWLGRLVFKRD